MRVLITGGRSAIAAALAKRQVALGRSVVVTASTEAGVEAVAARYAEDGVPVDVVPYSLDPSLPVEPALAEVVDAGVDALVLNAAPPIKRFKYVHQLTDDDVRGALALNIEGNLRLVRMVLPSMMERELGRLVFVSSAMVSTGTSRHGLYCLGKSAMEALFLNLAVDYARHNVLSNIVRPGIVRTDRTKRFWRRKAYLEKAERLIPQGKLGEPEQIAECFDPLLSETSYMNGAIVAVSGGLPMMNLGGIG